MMPNSILQTIKESIDNLYKESYQDYRAHLENAGNYLSPHRQERIAAVRQDLQNILEISQLLTHLQIKNHKEETE